MTKWRPPDWENHPVESGSREDEIYYDAYEAGADAMLKALEMAGRLVSEEEAEYKRLGMLMREARKKGKIRDGFCPYCERRLEASERSDVHYCKSCGYV